MPRTTFQDVIDQALCRKTGNPDTWFPGKDELGREAARVAKTFCDTCPIQIECLKDGLRAGEVDGIWGSLLPEERDALRPQRGGTKTMMRTRH